MLTIWKHNYHKFTYFILYSSLIIAFIFNENVSGGPYLDLNYTLKQVEIFEKDFVNSFMNYHEIEYPNRLSPVYISVLVFLKKFIPNMDLMRFVLMNILIISQIYFYKCLKLINIKNYSLDKRLLFILSCSIFLSPNFRANIIWIESSMFGLLFFMIGLYYFLKNYKSFNEKNVYLNIFFIALASYLRPSFCLFAMYFIFIYYFNFRDQISFYKIFFLNIILALPAFIYVFILEIYFIKFGGLSYNYFNKIAIISSILFFHSLPFILFKKDIYKFNLKFFLISILLSCPIIYFFDYNLIYGGGGIILHTSNFIFNNNYLFLVLIPFFIYLIFLIISQDIKNNLLLFLILFLIVPQYHIFHKYFDPLFYILSFSIINYKIDKKTFFKLKFIIIFYSLILIHYLISFTNSYYIKF